MQERDLKVLLVEDSPLLSERILELLSDMNGVVATGTATTESAAIQAISETVPDVILLDLHLKQGTGFSVMRQLRHMTSKCPIIIVITNYVLPQYRREAEALGARFFLDKSQDFDLIPPTLETLKLELCASDS